MAEPEQGRFPGGRGFRVTGLSGIPTEAQEKMEYPASPCNGRATGKQANLQVCLEELVARFPRDVQEAALGHKLGDAAGQAYARSELFERRSELMDGWATYLASQ
jgi:hypothetical protein